MQEQESVWNTTFKVVDSNAIKSPHIYFSYINMESNRTKDGRYYNDIYDVEPENELYTHGLFSIIHDDLDKLTAVNRSDVLALGGDPVSEELRICQTERIDRGREVYEEDERFDSSYVQMSTGDFVCREDDENSITAGIGGGVLLSDHHLREKLTHFDHENIPERVVHARGSGAFGHFTCTKSLKEFTSLAPLQEVGEKTEVFVRFSQVLGFKGSFDTARDARGFAIKFYTKDGNWDLVCNAQPVFFVQDAMKFPDIVHSGKPEPDKQMPQATAAHDNFWDFISLTPESSHMIMWVISDSGVTKSYRNMEGYAVHSFILYNEEGEDCFVKFHLKPQEGMQSLSNRAATKLRGIDSDYLRRDLWEAIERGFYPKWDFCVQIMNMEESDDFDFDPLDSTKIWPVSLFPLIKVGELTLDTNPSNFFTEVEQAAFCPGTMIRGIRPSNDPLLQGRLFSYIDTQINRFSSVNFNELPVNAPIIGVENNQRDGFMRYRIDEGPINYAPNSARKRKREISCPYSNKRVTIYAQDTREKSPKFDDHFTQANARYISLSEEQREHMITAFYFELGHVKSVYVRRRMIKLLYNINPDLAYRVIDTGLVLEEPGAEPFVLE